MSMNLKSVVERIVRRLWPELDSNTHLPLLGVVMKVPDPPAGGEAHTDARPRYAVDVRMFKPDGKTIDEDIPLLRDIPVALPAAAPDRGFAGLPQPGTIVEITFAFGRQSLPFVRSVLPFGLKLPAVDAESQRWQQAAASYQEVDGAGNWIRRTSGSISDQAQKISGTGTEEWTAAAPQVWIGNSSDNALKIDSDALAALISALETLAAHTHPEVGTISEGGAVAVQKAVLQALKNKLDVFVKT